MTACSSSGLLFLPPPLSAVKLRWGKGKGDQKRLFLSSSSRFLFLVEYVLLHCKQLQNYGEKLCIS